MDVNFADLLGKVITDIEVNSREDEDNTITFTCENGEVYRLYHSQDCSEWVHIDDICGDVLDLIGNPLLLAEEANSREGKFAEAYDFAASFNALPSKGNESETWTFYKLATIKGCVTIRWYGGSNGYYSESVSFIKVSDAGRF